MPKSPSIEATIAFKPALAKAIVVLDPTVVMPLEAILAKAMVMPSKAISVEAMVMPSKFALVITDPKEKIGELNYSFSFCFFLFLLSL